MTSLLEVLATRDPAVAAARLAEAAGLRAAFVDRFPTERWADLDVEEYALGTSIEGGSVCWWLEYHTRPVGSIAGNSTKKHLIWRREDGSWRFPPRYSSLNDAWESGAITCRVAERPPQQSMTALRRRPPRDRR